MLHFAKILRPANFSKRPGACLKKRKDGIQPQMNADEQHRLKTAHLPPFI
jgi:hypothetical protein